MNKYNEKSVGEVIREFLESASWKHKIEEVKVRQAWEELMSPSINRYTRKVRFRSGKLTLQIDSAPLKQELSYSTELIKKRINNHLGKNLIREVQIF